MKGRNRKYNEYKGITLIALVITIVVLIILAAISINMAFGSNGLITRAEEAKLQQKIADLQEMLDMEKMESLIDEEGHITIEDYLNHIKEEGIIGDEDIQDTDNEDEKYITVEDEYVFLVRDKNDGDVEIIYQGTAGNLLPNLQIEITNVTTSSITVKANASAMASGEYKYYIKNITKGEEEYTLKETSKTSEYTFEGLEEKNQYQIKVEATNPNGTDVKESGIIETTTIGEIEEQDIIFTYEPDGWTNGNVVVTADMSKITIPSGARVQTSKDASQWEDGNSQTFSENGEMYVRLYDGTNESNYAVAQVSKIDKTKPVINTATSTQTSITIGATDEASGIIGYAVTTSNTEPTEFTTVTNTASLSTTISDLSVGTTYYVWVKDEAGNISAGKEIATQNYIVTYYIDTNSTQTQAFAPGESVLNGLNFTPSKSGYTFVGWREDTTASSSVLSSKTMGTSNMTLYAVFSQNITVTKYNGSSSATTETKAKYYNNGNVANPSFTLSQNGLSGWTAAGWTTSTSATGSTAVNNGGSVTLSSNATYYGKYTQTITLSYNGNGATGGSTASQSGTGYYNSAGNFSNPGFSLRGNGFSRTSYSFINWAMGSASGTKYNAGASVTLSASTTFYATWKVNSVSIPAQIGNDNAQHDVRTDQSKTGPYYFSGCSTITFNITAKVRPDSGGNTDIVVGISSDGTTFTRSSAYSVKPSNPNIESIWGGLTETFTISVNISGISGNYYILHQATRGSYNWSRINSITIN